MNKEEWVALVQKSPFSSFFQTPECYDFYASLSFLKPFVFAVSENEKLVGLLCGYIIAEKNLLKRFFSRRAIVPGGLLLDENISENALQKLLNFTVKSLKNEVIYMEVRNYSDYSKFRSTVEKCCFCYQPQLNFHIQTQNAEIALKQLSSTKRRDIKISQRAGVETIEISDEKDLKNYYELLRNLYKSKVKTPLFPYEFFEKLKELPNGKVFGVKYQAKIIGGSACVFLENKAVYEWFACGLDKKFNHIYPSTLATWAGVEYAANNGYQYFDMMGAGKPGENYGVREFKAKFGGELVEFGRFLYVCNNFLYYIGQTAIKIIKRGK